MRDVRHDKLQVGAGPAGAVVRRPRPTTMSWPQRERGQGLVEFAVIFPIFAVLLFAVIDGGLLFGRYNDLNNAAKEAARLAAVGAPQADIVSRAEQQSRLSWAGVTNCSSTSTKDICVEWIPGPNGESAGQSGSSVRVTIRYRSNFLTPLPNWTGGTGWDVKVCAVQRLEQSIGSPTVVGQGTSC